MGHRYLTRSHRDPNRQMSTRGELPTVEGLLHGQSATRGPGRHRRIVVVRRPDREQRVACELHDFPAVRSDQLNQLAEAVVQQLGQLLDTVRAGSSQPFCERREPRDVGKQDRRREPLALCHAQRLTPVRKTPEDKRGNIAGELERGPVSFMPSSSNRRLHLVLPSRGAPRPRRREAPSRVLEWFAAQVDPAGSGSPNDVVLLIDGPVAKGRVVADGGCILGG